MGFMALPDLKPQFFPGVDRDQFHIELELPPGAAIDETLRTMRRVNALSDVSACGTDLRFS
jgi:multidrug efflux pump subunit AcrB